MKSPEPQQFVNIERRNKLSREEFSQVIKHLEKRIWKNLKSEALPFRKLSGRKAGSFLTPADAPIPDCQTCGACCTALPCVDVRAIDPTPAENYWNIIIRGQSGAITVNRQLKRDSETGNCLALKGEVGKTVGCGIYENRPEDCRKFDAGSDRCHALRRAYNLEPPLTDAEMMSFMMQVFLKDEPKGAERIVYYTQIQETATAGVFEIEIFLNDETALIIHRFDINEESWLESQFSTLTLAEARNLIASRTQGIN